MRITKNRNRKIRAVYFALLTVLIATIPAGSINALSGSSFNAGHIIDDSIFTNTNTMSVQDIQNFLNAKVPNCDTSGSVSKSYYYNSSTGRVNNSADTWVTTSRATYGQRYDTYYGVTNAAAPYVCLKSYQENTTTLANNLQTNNSSVSGSQSAAQIIYNAAQNSHINPQVLLVTLQKEQGLVTDDWPWTNEYQKAMGYACPDTAPCNSQYYGFYNQVSNAAAQFRRYLDNPNNYNYVVGSNNILYNPNTACGSSNVYIQNQATAGLYDYTPYQPNAAALANVSDTSPGGTGDSCSAYGNRNFWWYFNSWFGNSIGPGYSLVSTVSPSATIQPNEVVSGVQVTLHNESGRTWYSDGNTPAGGHPTRLAMQGYGNNPYANTSDPAWLGTQNQIRMDQTSVPSGSNATFTFSLKAPVSQINNYVMNFVPVTDGVGFYQNIGMQWILSTPAPNLSYQVTASTPLPASAASGSLQPVSFTVKNSGNVMWYGDKSGTPIGAHVLRLYTINSAYHNSPFYDSSSWIANNQIALGQAQVAPGESTTITFNASIPAGVGKVTDQLGLIVDGVTPYPNTTPLILSTTINDYQYQVTSNTLPTSLDPGEDYTGKILLKNTGTKTWYADGNVPSGENPLRLATPGYAANPLAVTSDPNWLGTRNQVKMSTPSVAPGETGEFDIHLAAPYNANSYSLALLPVIDGKFFLGGSVGSELHVAALGGDYQTVSGSVGAPGTMTPGQIASIHLLIKNNTNATWYADGSAPSNFRGGATRIVMYNPWYRQTLFANTSDTAWLGTSNQIKMTTAVVKPGETGAFDYTWKAPLQSGRYTEQFSLAIDGYTVLPFVGMQFVTTVN